MSNKIFHALLVHLWPYIPSRLPRPSHARLETSLADVCGCQDVPRFRRTRRMSTTPFVASYAVPPIRNFPKTLVHHDSNHDRHGWQRLSGAHPCVHCQRPARSNTCPLLWLYLFCSTLPCNTNLRARLEMLPNSIIISGRLGADRHQLIPYNLQWFFNITSR